MSDISTIPGIDEMDIQAVIDLAKEIVDQNRTVNIEHLFTIAKRRLNMNPRGLNKILKHLFDSKILIEGSKIIKSEVLNHEIREIIYNFLKKYPGVNFSALKNNMLSEFDREDIFIGTGQVIWHLEVLLKFKCINKIEYKNYTIYFPSKMSSEQAIFYFLLRDKINRKIIYTLIENEPIKQAEIPRITDELKGSIYYHIDALKNEEMVFSEKKTGSLEVWINPEKKSLILETIGDIERKLETIKKKYIGEKVVQEKDAVIKLKEVNGEDSLKDNIPTQEERTEELKDLKKEESAKKEEKKEKVRERLKTI